LPISRWSWHRVIETELRKHTLKVTPWRPSGDPADQDYPVYLTTGRVISQYLSGTQTRRIGALVEQYPEPRVEIHPRLTEQYGIKYCELVIVTTRRDEITLQGWCVYPTPEDHCILIRTSQDGYFAYSQKFTHLSCAVYYPRESGRLECPCHNGFFSVDDERVISAVILACCVGRMFSSNE
jgi:nitrite reductase/ring-hydroxylating ferredoxin subunit